MTPNFALSLSFDGLRLLHRINGGWALVGDVALDVPDLKAAMADLRKAGRKLEPDGMTTKLLIPNEQIKYLSIDSTQTSTDDIHGALDGLTPYRIDQLVIDFDRAGGRTHIAAVARETLREAEDFAVEHDFSPVCFAAIAEPLTFRGEVFFGPTRAAEAILGPGNSVLREAEAVKIISDARAPAPLQLTPSVQESAPEKPAEVAPAAKIDKDIAAEKTQEQPEMAVADLVFASRAKPLRAEATNQSGVAPAVVAPVRTSRIQGPEVEPLFTRRKEPPTLAVPTGIATGPNVAKPDVSIPAALSGEIVPAVPAPQPAPAVTGKPDVGPDAGQDPFFPTRIPDDVAAPIQMQSTTTRPTPAAAKPARAPRGRPRFLGLILTAILLLLMALVALWASTLSGDGITSWLRGTESTPAIAEAEAPPVAPATVEIPAEEIAAVQPAAISPSGSLPIVRAVVGRVLSPAEADRIYAATGVYQRAPRVPADPQETTLDGLQMVKNILASAPIAQPAFPDAMAMLPDPLFATPGNPPPPGTIFQRDLRGFILATPEGTLTPEGAVVFAGKPEVVPPFRPGTVLPPEPVAVAPVTPVTENGVRLVAGQPPVLPPVRPDDTTPQTDAAATPEIAPPTPPVAAPDGATRSAVSGLVATAMGQQAVATDATQSVPTPPADLENVVLVAGPPPRQPPLRPAAFAALATAPADVPTPDTPDAASVVTVNPPDAMTPGGVALAGFRPEIRPESVAPAVVAALAVPDPALAGFRPSLRPAGLAPDDVVAAAVAAEVAQAPQSPSTTDFNSVIANIAQAAPPSQIINATARAIVASPRPDLRPQNFDRVVANAETLISRQETRNTAAQTSQAVVASAQPASPSGPVPGSVAQAATLTDAIRLRDMNLIGVFGRPNNRRALIRLGNGRYVKVEVGSELDGGQVTAIGDSAINYVKRGRTYALQLPSG
jgi:hypothetical protein